MHALRLPGLGVDVSSRPGSDFGARYGNGELERLLASKESVLLGCYPGVDLVIRLHLFVRPDALE